MKNKSLENYYEKMRKLSGISNGDNSYKSTNTTLVEHVKTVDGTVLGIVKDAHNYYIKKTTSQDNKLNESDFAFIGGVENKNDYKYNSLGDAQKNLNLVIGSINETFSKQQKINTSNKITLNEDNKIDKPYVFLRTLMNEGKKDSDIEKFNSFKKSMNVSESTPITEDDDDVENTLDTAIDTLDDLDDQIKSEPEAEETPINDEPIEDKSDDEDLDVDDIDVDDEPETEVDNEEELDVDDIDVDDEPETEGDDEGEGEDSDLDVKELQKLIGKLTYKVRNLDLTPDQTKSFMNSILSSFETELGDIDLEDKKEMSNRILKTKEENSDEVSENIEVDDIEECDECKTFENYLKERGYENTSDVTIMEMANVISDYIDDNEDGLDDNKLSEIAEYCPQDVADELKEYGHIDEIDRLQPFIKQINETGGMKFGAVEADFHPDDIDINEDADFDSIDVVDDEINQPEQSFAPAADTIGVQTGTRAKLDVNLKTGDATISIDEQKQRQLKKYIRNRITEKFNGKKSNLNESKKTDKFKKLDEMIDKTLLNLTNK